MESNSNIIDASVIIPTGNRPEVLKKTLGLLFQQHYQPREVIIIDASDNDLTKDICSGYRNSIQSLLRWEKAIQKGAAVQRNQGVALSSQPYVIFMDDDVYLEPHCIERLWNCISTNDKAGGVNAMIINQQYHTPGFLTRTMYRLMNGKKLPGYAGKCIGPAWNLLPEDREGMPEVVAVEWLNLGCTVYRKDALNTPPFKPNFTGYSLMEDLALSLEVAKRWKIYNVRTARIYHDSQPGVHKSSVFIVSKMELLNRYYVMVKILGRKGFGNHLKLAVFELFNIVVVLNSIQGWRNLLPSIAGKFSATVSIIFNKSQFQ